MADMTKRGSGVPLVPLRRAEDLAERSSGSPKRLEVKATGRLLIP
jgi:hypothetical protein